MLKRRAKNKFRRGFTIFILFCLAAILIVALVLAIKNILPLLKNENASSNQEIINPFVTSTTLSDIKEALDGKGFVLESISESSASAAVVVFLREGPKVYFSKSSAADFQISSLQLIIQRLKVENKKPTIIDLRARRPIVKF